MSRLQGKFWENLVHKSDKTPAWLRPGSNSDKNCPIWGPDKKAQNPGFRGQASKLVAGGPGQGSGEGSGNSDTEISLKLFLLLIWAVSALYRTSGTGQMQLDRFSTFAFWGKRVKLSAEIGYGSLLDPENTPRTCSWSSTSLLDLPARFQRLRPFYPRLRHNQYTTVSFTLKYKVCCRIFMCNEMHISFIRRENVCQSMDMACRLIQRMMQNRGIRWAGVGADLRGVDSESVKSLRLIFGVGGGKARWEIFTRPEIGLRMLICLNLSRSSRFRRVRRRLRFVGNDSVNARTFKSSAKVLRRVCARRRRRGLTEPAIAAWRSRIERWRADRGETSCSEPAEQGVSGGVAGVGSGNIDGSVHSFSEVLDFKRYFASESLYPSRWEREGWGTTLKATPSEQRESKRHGETDRKTRKWRVIAAQTNARSRAVVAILVWTRRLSRECEGWLRQREELHFKSLLGFYRAAPGLHETSVVKDQS
ncbi:hypothetical protein R3P38DRAFT_2760561 [Favolaschia claudopus]|uniref:Uncharacterized protein n=1 Tax=Favolaschia claudopus TaxID=2862362 RepID=A0AAW0DUV5_9AGAR